MARSTAPGVVFLVLQLTAAMVGAAPALFQEALFPSASSKAAVLSALQLPKDLELPGTKYVEPKLRTGDCSIHILSLPASAARQPSGVEWCVTCTVSDAESAVAVPLIVSNDCNEQCPCVALLCHRDYALRFCLKQCGQNCWLCMLHKPLDPTCLLTASCPAATLLLLPCFSTAAVAPAPPPTAFTLSLVNVDYDLMTSMPPQLQLTLPGEAAPITIVRRPDVAAPPHVWVGELEAAPGAGSVVTLVLSEASRTVTGNAHYTDKATRTMRSFLVSSRPELSACSMSE
jgi:hypothetical protein